MSATGQFFIPVGETERLFRAVAKTTSQTVPELLRDVMRLWAADLMRQTYPKTRKQLATRIKAEVSAQFAPITNFRRPEFQERFKKRETFHTEDWRLYFDPFKTAEQAEAMHQKSRNKRTGRAPTKSAVTWVVRSSVYRRLLRARQKNIGKLKLGWAPVADAFHVKTPDWLPKGQAAQGYYRDDINAETLDGHLEAGNAVEYADRKLRGQFMDWILSKRANDLTSGKYAMRWKRKMEAAKA
jgi:hypothetical protein